MKKTILFFLLLAGTATALRAQNTRFYYQGIYYNNAPTTTADLIFNFPKPGKTKVVFNFYNVQKSTRVLLELTNIKQLNNLPNLDSMLTIVKNDLRYLSDSLKQDAIVRRVDYVMGGIKPQIKITNHINNSSTYTINNNELADLKVGQDTLRIKYKTTNGDSIKLIGGVKKMNVLRYEDFFITILANNLSDIYTLPESALLTCLNRLKQEITPEYVNKADAKSRYSAYFNMNTNEMFSPSKMVHIKYYSSQRPELLPNIYSSLQYVNGSFVPSMAAGLRYTFGNCDLSRQYIFAMWEPYFFFRRDVNNSTITDRNDFITLRYIETELNGKKGFDFVNNVSLGYLVRQQGNWFAPNTIKLGLPGVRSGWLQLEPELFFTGLFKRVTPSLKLTLHYQ
ncbi:MAG: hypothetical protein QM541_11035 [Flavobacterium sp.]|nr:hypothetical protein [Flavobacterium sp.]